MPTLKDIQDENDRYWLDLRKAEHFFRKYRYPIYETLEYREHLKSRLNTQKAVVRKNLRYIQHAIHTWVFDQTRQGVVEDESYRELKKGGLIELRDRYRKVFNLMRKYAPEKKLRLKHLVTKKDS